MHFQRLLTTVPALPALSTLALLSCGGAGPARVDARSPDGGLVSGETADGGSIPAQDTAVDRMAMDAAISQDSAPDTPVAARDAILVDSDREVRSLESADTSATDLSWSAEVATESPRGDAVVTDLPWSAEVATESPRGDTVDGPMADGPDSREAGASQSPVPVWRAANLPDVGAFSLVSDASGRAMIAYCDASWQDIYFVETSSLGVLGVRETVRSGWVRTSGDFAETQFSLVAADAGTPNVFWGEGGKVNRARRLSPGDWAASVETPSSTGLGRKTIARARHDGAPTVLTTYDYRVGGGYPFSGLFLVTEEPDAGSGSESIGIADEFIYDVDMALSPKDLPIIVASQRQYGGYAAFKIVYQGADGGSWSENTMWSNWGQIWSPVRVVAGKTYHALASYRYLNFSSPDQQPATENVSFISSTTSATDLAVDDADRPYVAAAASHPLLGARSPKEWKWFAVDDGDSRDPSETADGGGGPTVPSIRLARSGDIMVVGYLDDGHVLRLKAYRVADVRAFVDGS